MLFFILGSFALGIAWVIIFWVASFMGYLVAYICSLVGIYINISNDNNVWFLFMVVCGISFYIYAISNFGFSLFVFMSGSFMLFRTAENWRIASA